MSGKIVIEGFHRTEESGHSVSFTTLMDAERLRNHLRHKHGVCSQYDAEPVVVLLNTDGHVPGNCRGTVAAYGDDDHRAQTLERAIAALQSCLDGLREAGHHDWEQPEQPSV